MESPESLESWLEHLGLSKYLDIFNEHAIDFDILPDLTSQDLIELGIVALGDRKRILKAIALLPGATGREADPALSVYPRVRTTSEPERRHLTVMFCDLVGSTMLSVELDPEDYRAVITRYQACCVEIVRKFDGHVARCIGDSMLIYFGYPKADERDAERAIKTGLEIIAAVNRLTVIAGRQLQTRIGIATGEVIVSELAEGMVDEQAALGETPNLAARLQTLAQQDSILITSRVKSLVGERFEYSDLGEHSLKGFQQPLQVWRVVAENEQIDPFEAIHPLNKLTPLVDRQKELNVLLHHWRRVEQGKGQVVLLMGEAGIGKSRLARALRDRVVQSEKRAIMRCYCSPYYQKTALYPIIKNIEHMMQIDQDDNSAVKLAKLETALAAAGEDVKHTIPLFAELLSIPMHSDYPPLQLTPARKKEEILAVLQKQLFDFAARQPTLIIFEDLHWADPTSWESLQQLIRRIGDHRILLLITCRPEFDPVSHAYDSSHLVKLTLERLNAEGGRRMIRHLTEGKALPKGVTQQIISKTDGVPLFIEELTKMLLETGIIQDRDGRYVLSKPLPSDAVPNTLRDSLMARLDRLSSVREVAQLGAVIGREFSFELLSGISTRKAPALQDALARLVEGGLIDCHGTPPQANYSFSHALIQDVAYTSILISKRQELHARLGELLQRRHEAGVGVEPELLAHHFSRAGRKQLAIKYWQKAGRRAVQHYANLEAIEHLKKGLDILHTLPDTADRARRELSLLIQLGPPLLATRGFAAPEVEKNYTRAHQLCEQADDSDQSFSALCGLRFFYSIHAELQSAMQVGEQLRALARKTRQPEHILEAQRMLGTTCFYRGEFRDALDHFVRGIEGYRPNGTHDYQLRRVDDSGITCLSFAANTKWLLGFPAQARQYHDEALRLVREISHPFTLTATMAYAAHFHQLCRQPNLARERAEETISLADQHGFPYWKAAATIRLGWTLSEQGRVEQGIERLIEGITAYRQTGARVLLPQFLATLAEAYGKSGRIREGFAALDEALLRIKETGEHFYEAEIFRLKANLLSTQNDPQAEARAEACFHDAITTARRQSAKAWELRSAIGLARLYEKQSKIRPAHDVLAPVYGNFSEGFDSADLQDAGGLLRRLQV